ncbi:hypothetical protein JW905_09560 [bacterium]|nr:hypothetical protein [candidate division CSSED10-310 bacterium]
MRKRTRRSGSCLQEIALVAVLVGNLACLAADHVLAGFGADTTINNACMPVLPSITPTHSQPTTPTTPPTETVTPSPTNTATLTPNSTQVPLPTYTPTAAPTPFFNIYFSMPHHFFQPGTDGWLGVVVISNQPDTYRARLIVTFSIDLHTFWFWPSWCAFPPAFDYLDVDLPPGETVIELLPTFTWPDTGQDFDLGVFFGLLVTADDQFETLSDYIDYPIGWGPYQP